MNFADRLDAAVESVANPCRVGIDPHLALLPEPFAGARDSATPRAERARLAETNLDRAEDGPVRRREIVSATRSSRATGQTCETLERRDATLETEARVPERPRVAPVGVVR